MAEKMFKFTGYYKYTFHFQEIGGKRRALCGTDKDNIYRADVDADEEYTLEQLEDRFADVEITDSIPICNDLKTKWDLITDTKKNKMTLKSNIGIEIHCEDIIPTSDQYVIFMGKYKIAFLDKSQHTIPKLKGS